MTVSAKKSLEEKLKYLPASPGVYLMKNRSGQVIYVGKALSLNKRVRSYFVNIDNKTVRKTSQDYDDRNISSPATSAEGYQNKTDSLITNIADIDYIVTTTEDEAFLLEANLIKKYRPKYNIALKDDKRYPFLKLTTNEPYPRLFVVRQTYKDGARYFGPYTDAATIRKILRYIEWLLPLRTCKRKIEQGKKTQEKPCLNYQLGKCPAPCTGLVTKQDYRRTVKNIISFLNGRDREITEDLKEEMNKASEEMFFEKAAKIRDRIATLERMQRNRTIHFPDENNRDVIAIYKEEKLAAVAVLKILGGKLLNKENHRLTNAEDSGKADTLTAFISQYYAEKLDRLPHKILLSDKPDDYESLNRWLSNRLTIPQKGDNRLLMNIARKNAFDFIETIKLSHIRKTDRTVFPVQELKEKLLLDKLPRKMICIDISTIGGVDTVSSIVYFENGKPSKKRYRHLTIKNSNIQDDYAAIYETLIRYMNKVEDQDRPDLIVIDGGKGQLNAAEKALTAYLQASPEKSSLPIISLAKKVEQVFTTSSNTPLLLARSSSALRLLVNIRDEAHRFAISYHRKKRKKRFLASELDKIEGVGDYTKFLLLNNFGSVENIKKATVEELTQIKGIGRKTAKKITEALSESTFEKSD